MSVGDKVFVTVADSPAFPGKVVDTRGRWVRIAGRGSVDAGPYAIIYDEWFSLNSSRVSIKRAR